MFLLIYYVEGEFNKSIKAEIITDSFKLIEVEYEQNVTKQYLNLIQNHLAENNSKLSQLKSGDIYHLHDPTKQEVINFIDSYGTASLKNLIDTAKSQGIRCAYVLAYTSGLTVVGENSPIVGGGSYPLIGFDTLDYGMIYFEAETQYQVEPKIGKGYTYCVVGEPYFPGVFDTISDIIIIW